MASRLVVPAILILASLWGCASGPYLSEKQRNSLQVKQFDGVSIETLVGAFETALTQEGYTLTEHDVDRGVVAALKQDPTGRIEAFVDFEGAGDASIGTRLTFQRQEPFDLESERGQEILYDLPYLRVYLKVRTALGEKQNHPTDPKAAVTSP